MREGYEEGKGKGYDRAHGERPSGGSLGDRDSKAAGDEEPLVTAMPDLTTSTQEIRDSSA